MKAESNRARMSLEPEVDAHIVHCRPVEPAHTHPLCAAEMVDKRVLRAQQKTCFSSRIDFDRGTAVARSS